MAVYENLEYQMEDPGRGLELDMSVLPQGVGIGDVSADTSGSQGDPMAGLDSDGSGMFSDSTDNRVFPGMDNSLNMAGSPQEEILANEQMYGTQGPLPMPPVPETAQELLDS